MRSPSADLIDRYISHLRLAGKSPKTTSEWRRILTRLDLALPVGLANAHDTEITELLGRDGWSPATRRAYWQCLTCFYRRATSPLDGWLELDPMVWVPTPTMPHRGVPKPCTDAQLTALLARADQPYRLWCLLAAYAGLRAIEVARLAREHVTEQTIWVHGKGDKPGAVPTHPLVWAAVRHQPPGPLVRKVRGPGRATGDYVSTMSNHYFHRQLGMPDMHLHRLRHWFATRTLEVCGDVRVVQELLRHASPNTTAIYTQVAMGRRSAAVGALPSLVTG